MTDPAGTAADPHDHDAFRLPCDFYTTTAPRWNAHRFALPLPGSATAEGAATNAAEALVSGALCILFARITAHTAVPLRVARATSLGLSEVTTLLVRTAPATPGGEAIAQIAERLEQRDTDPGGDPKPPSARSTREDIVTIVVVESSIDRAVEEARFSNDDASARAPLRVLLQRTEHGFAGAFVYDAGRFATSTVERFAGHLGMLVRAVAAEPGTRVWALPLLTPAEREALDAVCEGGPAPPATESVLERIERHAVTSSDAVAVRHRDAAITYAVLDARANQLAATLASHGVGAESRVVVCLAPGVNVVVALLAVLKAGAVYVPLDPAYPPAYLRTILDDVAPALVLTERRFQVAVDLPGIPSLALDEPIASRDGEAEPARASSPERTAYVFYTSGTTGKPKGVMASYANLESYVTSARERYELTAADVVPALARFTFSISLFELLPILTAGGTLLLLDRETVLDPVALADTLRGVTFFHAGPSLMRLLLEHVSRHVPDPHAFANVRHASSGGDMVPADLLEAMKATFRFAEVFVIYGCTEVSCMGCTYPVTRDRKLARSYVGRPFAGTSVRVLDAHLARLPAGTVGEICFSGNGVVKGYLNRPELTAERFVDVEGRRYYRTGDLGRVSDEGFIEILGRSDFQAKVRGMRVELAEVEHHLRRAPGVKNGVVTTKDAPDGEKVLVAYVVLDQANGVSRDARTVTAATIRRHLVEHLPEHMVPAMYLELAELPLNHNMKVDRRALPAPGAVSRAPDAPQLREPESSTEKALASLFRRILGVEDVGLDDNFFELGGHSLLAVRLIAEVSTELGVTLGGLEVLRETLEVLARSCDDRLGGAHGDGRKRAVHPAPVQRIEPFHFGHDCALYGVLHHPTSAPRDEAVLICSPVGHERFRAQFVLHLLARRLGQLGLPVLRFDYFGTGNSLGDGADATCDRWRRDVAEARDELARRTGASRVVLVGARLGATLAWTLSDGQLDFARWVFWDPVCSGSRYVASLSAMHRRHVRAAEPFRWRPRMRPLRNTTELLGATYARRTIADIGRLSMAPLVATRGRPVAWLAGSPLDAQLAAFERLRATGVPCHFEAVGADAAWEDEARLEELLPDNGVVRALAAMVAGVP
jgi:amino acid adenylation domain-containing protein